MLNNPTKEKLETLKLHGMLKGFEEQEGSSNYEDLSFQERLGLLADRETTERENRRLSVRLRQAKIGSEACMANIDYRQNRGLDKSVMKSLEDCRWVKDHHNILITGPCGAGKSFIGKALAHQACLKGGRSLRLRGPRLFEDLAIAKGDGRFNRIMNSFAKMNVLMIDDWGLRALNDQDRHFLLEILEDRHEVYSTIMTSQLPVKEWHAMIGNATFADAILDRLVHNAYQIQLKGKESMRKIQAKERMRKSK